MTEEHQRLKDQVVQRAMEWWCPDPDNSPTMEELDCELSAACVKLNDHINGSATLEAETCEPPAEHQDKRWHFIYEDDPDDVLAVEWDGPDKWYFTGSKEPRSPAQLAANGYIYVAPCIPAQVSEEKVEATDEAMLEWLKTKYRLEGTFYVKVLKEAFRHFKSPSPHISDEEITGLANMCSNFRADEGKFRGQTFSDRRIVEFARAVIGRVTG